MLMLALSTRSTGYRSSISRSPASGMEFSEAQQAALSHRTGPMMVLAGPGSGKTTVITHRIKRLLEQGVSPSGILVITFTKAAAIEMEERFLSLMEREGKNLLSGGRVSFGTFHSIFYKILRFAYRFPSGNVIGEEEKRLFFREFLTRTGLEIEDEGEFVTAVMNEISYVKGNRLELSCYYSQNCPEEWFKRLYEGYENELARTGKIDFDDMLSMCFELFTERKDILAAWQRKFSYILIDEFQDINRLQYEIVKMLALPENNLFIVGDDDQSIYRFRGAKPELMLGFEKDYPTVKRILLGTNYRSTKEVVEASLRLIVHNKVRFSKKLVPFHGSGRPVDFVMCANPPAQMERVARLLREYQRAGFGWEQMAVLYRTGTSSGLLAEKLMEYNVPFVLRDAVPSIYSHWITKDILSYLALGAGGRRRSDFFRIMNRPNRYLSRDAFEAAEVSLAAVRAFYQDKDWMGDRITDLEADIRTIGRLKPYAAIQYIRQTVGYDRYLKEYAEFRRIDANELFDILWELSESAAAFSAAAEWAAHISRYQEELARQKGEPRDGVTLSTMHSAKGLEYAVVFLIDANEGVVPHHKAALLADLEEERRLFYVAMTRARERLHILAVRERLHKPQDVSRFVRECMEK